jgi:hypothetical protein
MSPPLADTPTLQQLLAMVASVQDQINALEYDADVSTRLRDIHTPTQLASALIEPGELILRLKAPITLPSGNTNIPAEKTIEFGLHWFIDGGGSTVSFFGKCVAERRTIFVGFVAKDIRGTFGGADVYPEWWGLVPGYHDIAINCAVKASTLDTNNFGIKVSLSNFRYDVSAPIDLSSMAVTLEGQGEGLTFLRSTANWNATWLKTDVWGTDTGPANHAAMVWIGGDLTGTFPYDARTYRCQVIGLTIECDAASFAHRANGEGGGPRRVSGISAKRWVEEGNAIRNVTVQTASGFGIGFSQHKAMSSIGSVGGWQAAVINGLSIRDFWIVGPTFRDAYPMYFSQWTNNCSVDTGTIGPSLAKSISADHAKNTSPSGTPPGFDTTPEGTTTYTGANAPAWIVDYPLIGFKAQGNMSISNVHFEGVVIGVHCEYNSSGGNSITLTNLNFLSFHDPIRGSVYINDGRSGIDFATDGDAAAASAYNVNNSNTTLRYFGYGCGVLISKGPFMTGTSQVEYNYFDRVVINGIHGAGGVTYLLRDALYGKNITAYGMGPVPTASGGGISFYSRGNGYANAATRPYAPITAGGASGAYDPLNPTSASSVSRTFFTGPIY